MKKSPEPGSAGDSCFLLPFKREKPPYFAWGFGAPGEEKPPILCAGGQQKSTLLCGFLVLEAGRSVKVCGANFP